jgi:hypothetical protein
MNGNKQGKLGAAAAGEHRRSLYDLGGGGVDGNNANGNNQRRGTDKSSYG